MELLNLIIEKDSGRLRNSFKEPDVDGAIGIYDYVHTFRGVVPEGHDVIEGCSIKDFDGFLLPKWTGEEWVESVTPEEMEIFAKGGGEPPIRVRRNTEKLITLQQAIVELFEAVPTQKVSMSLLRIYADMIIDYNIFIEDVPESLQEKVRILVLDDEPNFNFGVNNNET
jgi:hypothetical protein